MRCLALFSVLALASCAVADEDGLDEELEETDQDATTIWYTPITKEYFLPSAKIRTLYSSEAISAPTRQEFPPCGPPPECR